MKLLDVSRIVLLVFGIFFSSSVFAQTDVKEFGIAETTFEIDGESVHIFSNLESDQVDVKKLGKHLKKTRKILLNFLNSGENQYEYPLPSQIRVIIFKNNNDYIAYLDKNKNTVGNMWKNRMAFYREADNSIYTYEISGENISYDSLYENIVHEYTHHLFYKIFATAYSEIIKLQGITRHEWIDEGICQFMAGQVLRKGKIASNDIARIKRDFETNKKHPTILEIIRMKQSSTAQFYFYGSALIHFLIKHEKKNQIIEILDLINHANPMYRGKIEEMRNELIAEYGDHKLLDKAFHDYIDRLIKKNN